MATLFQQIRSNNIKSAILVILFVIIVGLLGSVLGLYYGNMWFGVIMSTLVGAIYFFIVFNTGGSMILNMTGARPVTKKEFPHLHHTIEGLAVAAGIPTPKAYVIDDTALNAFATGKDPKHSSVTVTTGLLDKLNRQELEGVIAHEMAHIKNFDIRLMMLTTVLVGVVTLLGDFFLRSLWFGGGDNRKGHPALLILAIALAILAPIIGHLMRLAVSRQREYLADATGAALTRYPPGLSSALKKIQGDPDPLVDRANRATAHLFISTPFRKTKGKTIALFATHPPIEERISRLEKM
ncbi:zinc metalloprotease HtpX [Candidatus Woesearchaeota archaeon]|nr:zinc metalloprotease HtpX [Candidatus Woesearchaeota archaeon]